MHEVMTSKAAFAASRGMDLSGLRKEEIKAILPCVVRYVLCKPVQPCQQDVRRATLMKTLLDIPEVNAIVQLLSVDFRAVEEDCRKVQELRKKTFDIEGSCGSGVPAGGVLEFEKCTAARKLKLVIGEVLWYISQAKKSSSAAGSRTESILDVDLYSLDASYTLCIAVAELPDLLPMCDVAEGLLASKRGSALILQLVANCPESFAEVCKQLISMSTVGGHHERRMDTLKALLRMNEYGMAIVQNYCLQNGLLPQLVLWTFTSVDRCQPVSDPHGVAMCLASLITKEVHKEDVIDMLGPIRELLLSMLTSVTSGGQLHNKDCMVTLVLLQLYANLKELSQFRLNEVECKELLRAMHMLPPDRRLANRWACLSLCFVIASMQHFQSAHLDKLVVSWLRWLADQQEHLEEGSSEGSTTVGQLLFLISIHFHSNQLHAVVDLVTSMLDVKTSTLKTSSLALVKLVFTQEVFTEQIVCQLATKIKVTKNINDHMTSYLPVHCVYQLIRSKAFSKYKVPIKDWIYAQVCEAKLPIHHSLPLLLRVYANSTLPLAGGAGRQDNVNEPIGEEDIAHVFSPQEPPEVRARTKGMRSADKDNFAPQLLMLVYVLLHQDAVNSHWKQLALGGKKIAVYSNRLLSRIPIKALLLKCRSLQNACAGLFATALRLLVTLYPHLCLADGWLPGSTNPAEVGRRSTVASLISQRADAAPETSAMSPVYWHARLCSEATAGELSEHSIEVVVQTLEAVQRLQHVALATSAHPEQVPRKLVDALKSTWFKCSDVLPRKLYIGTINAMRRCYDGSGALCVTEEEICADPLLLLQCDKALLRCPPLLEIVLKLLECYLVASENFYDVVARKSQAPEVETQELKYAAVSAQESAAIQLLLEECLPAVEETCLLTDLRETQSIVCSFVHRMFIRSPNIAKLVHFQGYDHRLVPVVVSGIPSAHICIDFVPELLSQPDVRKQAFAVELASMLCQQYPLPRSLSIARLCINTMSTLIAVLPIETVMEHIVPLLPSTLTMCRAMQPLYDDWIEYLARVCSIVFAHRGCFTLKDMAKGFL